MVTKKPTRSRTGTKKMETDTETIAEVVGAVSATIKQKQIEIPEGAKQIKVSTSDMLVRGLIASLDIGVFYNFTYEQITVATADATVGGQIKIQIVPSKWATKVAQAIWEYEIEGEDPTTVDTLVDGYSCVITYDYEEPEDEPEEEESAEESDEDAEVGTEEDSDEVIKVEIY